MHYTFCMEEPTAIRIVRCKRCGHRWATRLLRPLTCSNPKCRSPYWDRERRDKNENNKQARNV